MKSNNRSTTIHYGMTLGSIILLSSSLGSSAFAVVRVGGRGGRKNLTPMVMTTKQQINFQLSSSATSSGQPEQLEDDFIIDPTLITEQQIEDEEQQKLGIDIGKELDLFTSLEEKEILKSELSHIINQTIATGIDDLHVLKMKWEKEFEYNQHKLELIMNHNGHVQSQKFHAKVDYLVGNFLHQTFESRHKIHQLAKEDLERQQEEERKKMDKKYKKQQTTFQTQSWSKTNDPWDQEWDDW